MNIKPGQLTKDAIRLRTVFEYAGVGLSVADHTGHYIYANAAYLKIIGHNLDELKSLTYQDITHPDDKKENVDLFNKLTQGDIPGFVIENRYIQKGGIPIWVRKSVTAIRNSDNNIEEYIAIVENITKQKEHESNLIHERQHFMDMANSMPQLVWTARSDGTVTYYNEKYKNFTGIEKMGDIYTWKPVIHPDDFEATNSTWNESVRTGKVYEMEHRIHMKNGEYRWFLSRAIPTTDNEGKVTWYGTATDIHSQKESQTALQNALSELRSLTNQYMTLAETSPDIIARHGRRNEFLYINNTITDMTGIPAGNFLGKTLKELGIDPEVCKVIDSQLEQVFTKKRARTFRYDVKIGRKTYTHHSRLTPEFDEYGNVVSVLMITRDITDIRRLERQKDDFLAVASHELKTPVTSLKAYAQTLQHTFKKKGDVFGETLLEKMDSQIDRLTVLITDLLDVTKIESGKLTMHMEKVDVGLLIHETVEEIQRTSPEVPLRIQMSQPIITVCDRERIAQVLINLLTNAIKYSPKGSPIIVASSYEKGRIIVSVSDQGIGIPKEKQKRLFERFYRVDGEKRNTFPGLGLGLFISKEIISRHNGTLSVESEEKKGTTFTFSLPIILT